MVDLQLGKAQLQFRILRAPRGRQRLRWKRNGGPTVASPGFVGLYDE